MMIECSAITRIMGVEYWIDVELPEEFVPAPVLKGITKPFFFFEGSEFRIHKGEVLT